MNASPSAKVAADKSAQVFDMLGTANPAVALKIVAIIESEQRDAFKAVFAKLESLRKKNNEDFGFAFEVRPNSRTGELVWVFRVKERADGHVLLEGTGESAELAILSATAPEMVEAMCKDYDYDTP